MIYEAKLDIPIAWDDGAVALDLEYIPNGFDKKLYAKGILAYKKEFRSKSEAIDFIKELLTKFSNLLKNEEETFIGYYKPKKGIEILISNLESWRNRENKYYNGYNEDFHVYSSNDFYDPMTGEIEIVEKHFTHNFSLLFTEEEYNLINSDIRFKVSCGEIKEAILNCYRNKETK